MALPMKTKDVYETRGFGGRQGAGEHPAVVVDLDHPSDVDAVGRRLEVVLGIEARERAQPAR